jgi:hypothetical protein
MRKYLMVCIAVVFMFGMVMPAAADTSFYGQVWFDMYQNDTTNAGVNPIPDGDSDLVWQENAANSRFGAKFKGDVVDANVEIRRNVSSYVRHWYADWKMGGGKTLRIGQNWDAAFVPAGKWTFIGGTADLAGRVRTEQVTLLMPAGPANLTIALETPATASISGFNDTDTSLPLVFFKAGIPAGPATLTPFVGYNTYSQVTGEGTALQNSIDVDTTIFGINVKVNFGQVNVAFVGFSGTNLSTGFFGDAYSPVYVSATKTLYDSDTTGYHAAVGFKVSDMVKLQGGYGSYTTEVDTSTTSTTEKSASGYYANAVFTLAKGVEFIVAYDFKDKGDVDVTTAGTTVSTPQGDQTCIGARFKLYF